MLIPTEKIEYNYASKTHVEGMRNQHWLHKPDVSLKKLSRTFPQTLKKLKQN